MYTPEFMETQATNGDERRRNMNASYRPFGPGDIWPRGLDAAPTRGDTVPVATLRRYGGDLIFKLRGSASKRARLGAFCSPSGSNQGEYGFFPLPSLEYLIFVATLGVALRFHQNLSGGR